MKKVALFILLSWFSALSIFGQSPEDYFQQADAFYKIRKVDSSLILFRKVLDLTESVSNDTLWLKSFIKIANITSNEISPAAGDSLSSIAFQLAQEKSQGNKGVWWLAFRSKAYLKNNLYEFDSTIYYLNLAEKLNAVPNDNFPELNRFYAWAYLNKYDLNKASKYAQRGYGALKTQVTSDTIELINILTTLSAIYDYASKYDSSLIYARENLDLISGQYPNGHPNIGIAHDLIGSAYQNLRQFDKALYHRKMSEDIGYRSYLENNQTYWLGASWLNLGYLYQLMNESYLAKSYTKKSLDLVESTAGINSPQKILHLTHLAEIAIQENNTDEASRHIQEAIRVQKYNDQEDLGALMIIKNHQVDILWLQGKYSEAIKLCRELEDYFINNQLEISKQLSSVYKNWGLCLEDLGQYKEAIAQFNRALAIDTILYTSDTKQHVAIYNNLSRLHSRLGKVDAEELNMQILKSLRLDTTENVSIRNATPHEIIPEMVSNRLLELQAIQKTGVSINGALLELMSDYEYYLSKHLGWMSSDETVQEFIHTNKDIYTFAIEILLQSETNDPDELYTAFRWGDINRGSLLKLQANIQNEIYNTGVDTLATLKQQIRKKQQVFLENTGDNLDQLRQLDDAIADYKNYTTDLLISNPNAYYRNFALTQLPSEFINAHKPANKDIIQLSKLTDTWSVFIWNMDGISHFEVPHKQMDKNLSPYLPNKISNDRSSELYALLIKPIIDRTKSKKWIIIPEGELAYLNFELIKVRDENYLIEDYSISYANSISLLDYKSDHRRKKGVGTFAPGFFDNLKEVYFADTSYSQKDSTYGRLLKQPFMIDLAADLNRQYRSRTYIRQEATEGNVKRHAKDFNIVHFGTHSELDDQNPLHSKIILAKEQSDTFLNDGYLHTYEIYGMDIPADLAVLAACQTGSGLYKAGEGIISLAHAFQYAGCPSVVTSLWKIDEKTTSELLKRFYNYLAKNWDKSSALRQAKLDYLAEAPMALRAPYYWAGLILIGNEDPIRLNRQLPKSLTLVAALVAILLLGLGYTKIKGSNP